MRKIFIVIICIFSFFFIGACSRGDNPEPDNATTEELEDVVFIAVKSHVEGWQISDLGILYFGKAVTPDGVLRWNLGDEPQSLDPAANTGFDGAQIINNTFEGLMRKEGNLMIPAAAERFSLSEDGLVYKFELRASDWSDGSSVTAADFEYAWKRALAPDSNTPSVSLLFGIKGARAYHEGKGEISSVGVKALDDRTLEVTLEAPSPEFLELTSLSVFMPLKANDVRRNVTSWSINPDLAVSNGPFQLSDYKQGERIVLTPNPYHWSKDSVKLSQIQVYLISDRSMGLEYYEADRVEVLGDFPEDQISRLIAEDPTFLIIPIKSFE